VESLLTDLNPHTPPLDQIHRILFAMASDVEMHREDLKLVIAFSLQDAAYTSGPTGPRQRILEILTKFVAGAQRHGQARTDLHASRLAEQIMGLYNNAVLTIFGGRGAKATINALWRFLLGGIVVTTSAYTAQDGARGADREARACDGASFAGQFRPSSLFAHVEIFLHCSLVDTSEPQHSVCQVWDASEVAKRFDATFRI
jgi:hypothetical protein